MKHKIYKKLKQNFLTWKFGLNAKSTFKFLINLNKNISPISHIVVKELNEKGISFQKFEDIFKDISFEEFEKSVLNQVENYHQQDERNKKDEKLFAHFILGTEPKFEKNSLWNKMASNQLVQSISDNYYEMKNTKMRYYNIWKHQSGFEQESGSQLWHRDREDLQILKMFIYLTDVDENGGPFTYAPSTHIKGKIQQEPEYLVEFGVNRTTNEMMDKLVPKEKWITATAKKGTVIFADTHGYHKGGFVKEGYRILFTAMYVSPDCKRRYFKL